MEDGAEEVNTLFAPNATLPADVLHELLSICRLYSLSPQELFFKWESYVIKMGVENVGLEYKTARDFRKNLEDAIERESRAKVPQTGKKPIVATPRAGGGTRGLAMLDGIIGSTPSRIGSVKRKPAGDLQTPSAKAAKNGMHSSPMSTPALDVATTAFADRQNPGQVMETLNPHLPAALPTRTSGDARVKLKANTELPKFAYRPMAMQLSSASEILDDRIDTFVELVQQHHNIQNTAFGNPAAQSTAEIVAVGRIACDQPNGKLNAPSIVLETSRRMGAGMRVPLRFGDSAEYDLFPGKIVALRGTNVSGDYFAVTEILPLPLLPPPASTPAEMDVHNDRLTGSDGQTNHLTIHCASGPYTPDTDLDFAALHTLLENAAEQKPDVLVLTGPFLDLEHPLIASGDLEAHLPPNAKFDPDRATLTDVFRILISSSITSLVQAHPTVTIILVPSVRDAISKHVSYPQDRFPKPALGLPKQVHVVTNPITLSVNEIVLGITSQDVLSELRRDDVYRAPTSSFGEDLLARLSRHVIEQRHFFPVFPAQGREDATKPAPIPGEVPEVGGEERLPVGACLDVEYLKLAEWLNVRPDVLILPSVLTPFAKVREVFSLVPAADPLRSQYESRANGDIPGRRGRPLHQPRHAVQEARRRHLRRRQHPAARPHRPGEGGRPRRAQDLREGESGCHADMIERHPHVDLTPWVARSLQRTHVLSTPVRRTLKCHVESTEECLSRCIASCIVPFAHCE